MSKLSDRIAAFNEEKAKAMPAEVLATLDKGTRELKDTGIEDLAVKDGDAAPLFSLDNHLGDPRSLEAMLAKGPVVLSFYRGGW